jgi:hypothetical protein
MNRIGAFCLGISLVICLGIGILLTPRPASSQNTGTDLGSLAVQNALQRPTSPQSGDLTVLYRGTTGAAVYTPSAAFTFAISAVNAQANFGGL